MTMQHSLEMRLPYLDHHLVELGLSLPLQYLNVNSPRSSRLIWALYVLEVYLAFALHPQEGIYSENLEDRRSLKISFQKSLRKSWVNR